jgi:hypothetical protein
MISLASNAGSGACTDRSATIIAMPAKPVAANDGAGLNPVFNGIDGIDRSLAAGESLFLQDDAVRSIYLLRSGWAFRSQCLENGGRQIVDFVLTGEVLGIDIFGPAPYAVETLTPLFLTPGLAREFPGAPFAPAGIMHDVG